MLRLEGVESRQGEFRLQADWEVPTGARVALIGPSGAGKSTLLAVIAGFLAPEAGRICWEGRDLTQLPPPNPGAPSPRDPSPRAEAQAALGNAGAPEA